jgi:hypothetical protein
VAQSVDPEFKKSQYHKKKTKKTNIKKKREGEIGGQENL